MEDDGDYQCRGVVRAALAHGYFFGFYFCRKLTGEPTREEKRRGRMGSRSPERRQLACLQQGEPDAAMLRCVLIMVTETTHVFEPLVAPDLAQVWLVVVHSRVARREIALSMRNVVLEPIALLVRLVAPRLRAPEGLHRRLLRLLRLLCRGTL